MFEKKKFIVSTNHRIAKVQDKGLDTFTVTTDSVSVKVKEDKGFNASAPAWGAALHPPIPYAAYPLEGMPWG